MSEKSALPNPKSELIEHSIVICTAGRMEILSSTLRDLDQGIKYPNITELIVVNNGQKEESSKFRT